MSIIEHNFSLFTAALGVQYVPKRLRPTDCPCVPLKQHRVTDTLKFDTGNKLYHMQVNRIQRVGTLQTFCFVDAVSSLGLL